MGRGGVEPPTSHFSGERSYRLSYLPHEAVPLARAVRLPYNSTLMREHRGGAATLTGLEPATSAVTGRRANQLRYRALLVVPIMLVPVPSYERAVRTPNGIRTRATALKGRRPGPLDDGGSRTIGARRV